MSGSIPPYPVEGTLSIDIKCFPREILDEMLNSNSMAPLNIMMPRVFLQDGISIISNFEGTRIEFTFATPDDVKIEEA